MNEPRFKVGDKIRCDCEFKCLVSGIIHSIDLEQRMYRLSDENNGPEAYFETSRLLTPLEGLL